MAKRTIKRNQVIVASLVLMLAVAGYMSYAGISNMNVEEEHESVETAEILQTSGYETAAEQPGDAVLTNASAFAAQAKVSREQVRAQNKELLREVIDNEGLSEDERQSAVASMVEMTDLAEKEAAAEMMLEAKGFDNVVVNLTGGTADVMVPSEQLSDTQRAQIEDIVMRKTEIAGENIVITPMESETERTAEE